VGQLLNWLEIAEHHQLLWSWEDMVSFHAHTTASATEVFQLPVLLCGTPCHLICGRIWTTATSSMHWKDKCLGYSRPRRTVTNLLSCALEAYLLTYLLTYNVNAGSSGMIAATHASTEMSVTRRYTCSVLVHRTCIVTQRR